MIHKEFLLERIREAARTVQLTELSEFIEAFKGDVPSDRKFSLPDWPVSPADGQIISAY